MSESSIVSVEHLPTAVVVHVLKSDLIRKSDLDAICSEIDTAQSAAASLPFIHDMGRVTFMGSLAMGTLVGQHNEFKARGQRLIFVSLQDNLRQSISITKLDQILAIMPDVPTALQSLGPALG
jgi:anti-anti-sigma factor